MKLANIDIHNPILLAPLAGLTDLPFRTICHRHGAGMVFTELISAEGIVRNNPKTIDLLKISEEEKPVSIQIFGKDPNIMSEAAQYIETLKPATIDINMGCCAPKVCNGNSGAALLKDLDILYKIASQIVAKVSIPVSAKIRTGWCESSKNYLDTVSALQDAGVCFITVHGRTRQQKYTGLADWDIISEIADFAKVPIIGNGDIQTHAEALNKLKTSGCDAVMIGRAALGNPWVFSDKQPSRTEVIEQIKSHLEMMLEHYGEYGVILMRKHIVKYIHGFRNSSKVRGKLVVAKTKEEVLELLKTVPLD
jgi:tRNA-dihydrouridine synthase B